ncbi:MAG: glycosyltransferase family 2 protein [Bacteroidales bacterium]|nr:glycosyltransferase family 2 protein [Bacteroidales bacterium]
MLSILIPIYNYDARELVRSLHNQATEANIEFEILLLDDASENTDLRTNNQVLKNIPNVTLLELPTKAGRSVARNFLAGQAKYPYLLFLDCDSEPVDNQYIQRYIPFCNKEDIVVCGGTAYKKEKPPRNCYLRWVYGTKCETTKATERNLRPNSRFSTFNFLISKNLFWSIRFNELLKNYGHEDTLFGLELKKRNIPITHIDNPLYHLGIDTNEEYLQKTRQGVENLKILLDQYPDKQMLIDNIRLLKYYHKLEITHTLFLAAFFFFIFKSSMESNFKGRHPSLVLFNLYKISYLSSLNFRKKIEI